MMIEKEIRKEIKETIEVNKHILDCGPATVGVNSVRALMQISATSKLYTLYLVLGEKRPKFKCDDVAKTDQ